MVNVKVMDTHKKIGKIFAQKYALQAQYLLKSDCTAVKVVFSLISVILEVFPKSVLKEL